MLPTSQPSGQPLRPPSQAIASHPYSCVGPRRISRTEMSRNSVDLSSHTPADMHATLDSTAHSYHFRVDETVKGSCHSKDRPIKEVAQNDVDATVARGEASSRAASNNALYVPHDASSKTSDPANVHGFVAFKAQFLKHVEAFFEAYAHFVYDHPKRFIVIPVIVCIFLSAGFLFRRVELDMVRLYGLPSSESLAALKIMQHEFPVERLQYILALDKATSELNSSREASTKGSREQLRGDLLDDQMMNVAVGMAESNKGANILTKSRLPELYQFWMKLLWLHVPRRLAAAAAKPGDQRVIRDWLWSEDPLQLLFEPDFEPARYKARREKQRAALANFDQDYITLQDVCVIDGFDHCKLVSIFDVYTSPAHWGNPLRTDEFPQYINKKTLQASRLDAILGGMELRQSGSSTTVVNATAIMFRVDLNGGAAPDEVFAWEQGLLAMARTMRLPTLALFVKAERSVNDELALSSLLRGEDLLMLIGAAVFVTIFTVTMTCSLDPYRSKALPAFIGVATTLLSYGGGVGLFHLLGLPHVPPSEATPFIVLAINVDDIFVLSNAYSMTYLHSRDAKTRMGLTMKDAGISVTLTTVTNIVAFAIGASTYYYAIRVFCIVTCAALVAGYVLALTVFFGALSVSARLEERYRPGPLLCVPDAGFQKDLHYQKHNPRANAEDPTILNRSAIVNRSSSGPLEKDRCQLTGPAADERSTSATVLVVYNEPRGTYSLEESDKCRRPESSQSSDSDVEGLFVVEKLTNQYVIARRVAEQCRRSSHLQPTGPARTRSPPYLGNLDPSDDSSRARENDYTGTVPEMAITPVHDPSIELTWLENGPMTTNMVESPRSYDSHRAAGLRLRSPSPQHRDDLFGNASKKMPDSASTNLNSSGNRGKLQETSSGATVLGREKVPSALALREITRLISVGSVLIPERALRVDEPPGTVGSWARTLEMKYVGIFLTNKLVKLFIVAITVANFIWSGWMCTNVKSGIQVEDVTPFNSYLRDTLNKRGQLYASYGEECIVYFQGGPKWWNLDVQDALLNLTHELSTYGHIAYVHSGMIDFLKSSYYNGAETASLPTDAMRKEAFMDAFVKWKLSARGKNFGHVFQLRDGVLESWKFYYWLQYSTDSHDNHVWQKFVQVKLRDLRKSHLFNGVWTWSALGPVWESDPIIFRATMQNMIVAMVSMGAVAVFLIPDLFSSFLVLGIIILIYTNVYGYMYLWGLNLNMLTMVNLVLAIGFAVDYTAHMTHCFSHCKGETRNRRAVETLVMMGLPVTNGMLSTYAAVIMLCVSRKYIMIVIFEMTITIIASAFWHGAIFMPVLLSYVGPLSSAKATIVEIDRGRVVNSWTVELSSEEIGALDDDGINKRTSNKVIQLSRRTFSHSKLKKRAAPLSFF